MHMSRLILSVCALGMASTAACGVDFAGYTNTAPAGQLAFAQALLGSNPALTIDPNSIVFVGTTTGASGPSASYARNIDLGTQGDFFYALSQDGLLLSSGSGTPPNANTNTGFSVSQTTNTPDTFLTALVGRPTNDTTALQFDFTVDPGIVSIGFEFMFGSDEYPEYANQFPDGAAVLIDGVNYAYYNNDPNQYLSVKSSTINGTGVYFDNTTKLLPIEYDGITRPSGILAPLDLTKTTHRIRIAVADTTDTALDSAIIVANLYGSTEVVPNGNAGIVPLASPRMTNYNPNCAEGDPDITIPVRLSQAAFTPVTVDYAITGTAVLGVDYTVNVPTPTGTLNFAVGEFLKNVIITPLTDKVIDGSKTVKFQLTNAFKAIPIKGKAVNLTIMDVDGGPTVGVPGNLPENPTADQLVDGKEQGNNRCGAGTGIATLLGLGLLLTWQRRRTNR